VLMWKAALFWDAKLTHKCIWEEITWETEA